MTTFLRQSFFRLTAVVSLTLALNFVSACDQSSTGATVRRIQSSDELIGGPGALGHVGDYIMENGAIRLIVQSQGFSRGFGIYGGGIIDADLQRPGSRGDREGLDNFGEMFPAFFLAAMQPRKMKIIDSGEQSGIAHLRVTGSAADFIAMVSLLTPAMLDQVNITLQVDYILHPGDRYVRIDTSLINETDNPLQLNNIQSLLDQFDLDIGELPLPAGDVVLFGSGNDVFLPGLAGFDVRFTLEDIIYSRSYELPALAGLVTDFIATAGPDISYGLAVADDPEHNYAWRNRDQYPDATPHSLMVPFLFDSFTGAYHTWLPDELAGGSSFTMTKYFMLGKGDVGSIRDVFHRIQGDEVGRLSGRVIRKTTLEPEYRASVVVLDDSGQPFCQYYSDAEGYFTGTLPPGSYSLRVLAEGRYTTEIDAVPSFTIETGKKVFREIILDRPGTLAVNVYDTEGNRLPAKATIVGMFDEQHLGSLPRDFLFDLKLGEHRRPTDLSWHFDPDQATRQYIEDNIHLSRGRGELLLRPGDWEVVVSRGPEYTIYRETIRLDPGQLQAVDAVLERVVDTTGYVSGDLHLHTSNSLDSFTRIDDRVSSLVAEGLEFAVVTDHNYITDPRAEIARRGLQSWIHGMVGIEYTTLEMGHFNAYPLRYDSGLPARGRSPYIAPPVPGSSQEEFDVWNLLPDFLRRPNRPLPTEHFDIPPPTGFEWSYANPHEVFGELRWLGQYGPDNTIVQVNHVRDTILGYFNQFYLDSWTAVPRPPDDPFFYPHDDDTGQWECQNFSYDFDAIELLNGMRLDQLRGLRIPTDISAEALEKLPEGNEAGGYLLDEYGQIAYPGQIDDWFNLLNRGYTFTGVGNSDSHELLTDHVGNPRTYLRLGLDQPADIGDLAIVRAIKGHRSIVSNGPFVDLIIDTDEHPRKNGIIARVGDLVSVPNGRIQLIITVQAPPWIRLDKVRLWRNGELMHEWDEADGFLGQNVDDPESAYQFAIDDHTFQLTSDSWLVVEVLGDEAGRYSLWPVYSYKEVPPTNLDTAVGGIAEPLGFSMNKYGDLRRGYVQVVYPYAITNPIWVDVDGNGVFNPPEPRATPCQPWPQLDSDKRMVKHNRDIRHLFERL